MSQGSGSAGRRLCYGLDAAWHLRGRLSYGEPLPGVHPTAGLRRIDIGNIMVYADIVCAVVCLSQSVIDS
mgnify:CR=1 FL=1